MAIPWLAYELTHSGVVMASLYAFQMLPQFLLSGIAGVAADRLNRWRLMVASDVGRGVLVALIPVLVRLGALRVWHFYGIGFALSCLNVLYDISYYAVFPEVVGDEGDLTTANSRMWAVLNTADVVGPALGGLLLARFEASSLMFLDSLSFLLSLASILLIAPPTAQTGKWGSIRQWWQDLLEGVRMLLHHPLVRQMSLTAAAINLGYGSVAGVLVFYLRSVLNLNAELAGTVFSCAGVGSILGALITATLSKRRSRGPLVRWFLAFSTGGALTLALLHTWLAAAIGYGLFLGAMTCINIVTMAIRQEIVPNQMLGRVISVHRMLAFAGIPLGSVVASASVARIGATGVLVVGSLIMFVACVVGSSPPLSQKS